MKLFGFLFSFLLSITVANAQLTRIVHQSFDMGDIDKVVMQLKDSIVVMPWEGNTVMSETNIYIENTEPRILDGFIKEGRYKLIGERKGDGIVIVPAINRKKIRTKSGLDMNESVRINIFVPKKVKVVGMDGLVIPPSGEVARENMDISDPLFGKKVNMNSDSLSINPTVSTKSTGKSSKTKKGKAKKSSTKKSTKSKKKKN